MINPYTNCPAVKYHGNEFFARDKMQKTYDKFKDDFSYLQNNTGLPFRKNDIYDAINNIYLTWDTLTIEVSVDDGYRRSIFPKKICKG